MVDSGATSSVRSTLTSFLRFAGMFLFGIGFVLSCIFLAIPRLRYTAILLGGLISCPVGVYLYMMSWLRGLLEYLNTQTSSATGRRAGEVGTAARAQEARMQSQVKRFQAWWSWKGPYLKRLSQAFGLLSVIPLGVLLATVNRRPEMYFYLLMVGMTGLLLCGSIALLGICGLASRVADLVREQDPC